MKLALRTPIVVAAGPWSSGEAAAALYAQRLAAAGAVVSKTVTWDARPGNAPPTERRLAEDLGWLNRGGLRNPGARAFVDARLPRLLACGAPLWLSIYASKLGELERMIDALEPCAHHGYEFNASCPNLDGDPLSAAELLPLLRGLRQRTRRPIWVKLGYQPLRELRARAQVCADAGADAITACNTVPALDPSSSETEEFTGGLSGPALRPLSLWAVAQLARMQLLPIIGVGGIRTPSDVRAFAAVGASAVQIGSALLDAESDGLIQRLVDEITKEGYQPCPRA